MNRNFDIASGQWSETPADIIEIDPAEALAAELAKQRAARQVTYTSESDPLFFKWQAGEATEAEWLAKREEIRARFPYPETDQ